MAATSPLSPPVALCLGGMDPSGGAGLLRDALTVAELGCLPMAISLAETLQNSLACTRIEAPGMDPVLRLETLAPHLTGCWGAKLSLCALSPTDFRRLCATLRHLAPPIRIWDPILAPSAGVGLHDGQALRHMATDLLAGGGWVVSPNRGEAAAFAGLAPELIQSASVEALTQPWLEAGAAAVWLKGGHAQGGVVQDVWVTASGQQPLDATPRLAGERRGTGCTLSATWLALRLLGLDDLASAREAARQLRARWQQTAQPGGLGRQMFLPLATAGRSL